MTKGRKRMLKLLLFCVPVMLCGFFVAHFLNGEVTADQSGNIVKNGGFEQETGGVPTGWSLEKKVRPKGELALSKKFAHSGQFSLSLMPNRKNTPWDIGHDPYGVGQGFPAGRLRGKKIYISAWLAAEGDTAAAIDVVALGGKVPALVELKQNAGESKPVFRDDVLEVPKDAVFLVVACVAQGTSGTAYIDDVFVSTEVPASWNSGGTFPPEVQPGSAAPGAAIEARVAIDASKEIRNIPATLYGMNLEWIWDGNGIWDKDRNALDPRIVSLTKDLGTTLLRFPGGIFSDFYHWRDGTGAQAKRPTTKSMPGGAESVHRFGTDEALAFAAQTGSHLLITVNAGTGTAQEAADWVRYVNRNGRQVEYWEVGNELYIKGGQRAFDESTMPPERYAQKFLEFARAMRAADSGIKIGAIGDENFGDIASHAYGDWTSKVLSIAGKEIDFLSIHNGYSPVLFQDKGAPLRRVYGAMLAAPELLRNSLAATAAKVQTLGPERAAHIRLAITEWGPYFQLTPDGRYVDHVKTLGSALYVASAMKAFIESPQTDIATGFKLVDPLFQGWIGKRNGEWITTAPYYALQLYTRHFGSVLVSSNTQVAGYNSQPVGLVGAASNVPYLDIVASRGSDGRTLYVMGINKNFDQPVKAQIAIAGRTVSGEATAWTLNGTGVDANTGTRPFEAPGVRWAKQEADSANPRFNSGGDNEITFRSSPVPGIKSKFEYTFPAHSVTSLEVRLR